MKMNLSGVPGARVLQLLASVPAHYERDQPWQQKGKVAAADRYTLQTPNRMTVNVNDVGYLLSAMQDLDLSSALSWDTTAGTDYTQAANRAGVDFFIYACTPESGTAPKILISANSTVPDGYDADTSRKIGGFHCLCANAGTISGHSLTGFAAGDILPASIWDLKWRPRSLSPAGMVFDEKSRIWVDIYLASGTGASTASAFGATISDNRNWMDFVDDGGAVGKRLLTDHEFQLAAAGSNEETNIAGSADPVTTGGHSDTASRRMISNIGCEDMCGAMWQWLLDQSFRCDPDGTSQAATKTLTITHAASPGGNPVYLKFGPDGEPYLCCNMATDAADKILTFGSAYTLIIKHDANAATGGYQVYFDEDATQPARLLCALPGLKNEFIRTSNPNYWLQITYNAAPATPGVAISYDDGSDERLEFTSPTSANGTLDLALNSQIFAYYDLPGSKGSIYRQGTYGDIKLLAGAVWDRGSYCGSRARCANSSRWNANTNIGGRFAADTGSGLTPGWIRRPCPKGQNTQRRGRVFSSASESHPAQKKE